MKAFENFLPALGRILLSLIFVLAGYRKLTTVAATVVQMAHQGIPYSNVLVWGAIAIEFVGGLMLVAGLFTRCVAFALAIYIAVLAVLFHAYWAAPAAEARNQFNAFFEHLAMIGGMLYVVTFGPGAYSIDALLGRQARRPAVA
jgi:putative oxidoreductase